MNKSELLEIVSQCNLTEESNLQIESELNTVQEGAEVPVKTLKMVIDLIKLEQALDDETLTGIEDLLQKMQETEKEVEAIKQSTEEALDQAQADIEEKAKDVEDDMAFVNQVVDQASQMD